ncbi:MAG: hypothetical protein AAGC53_06135 [Actinomycetota bacterium]
MQIGSFRWWFENRETGKITVAQPPNRPLALAFVGIIGDWIFGGFFGGVFGWLATVGIAWWAMDEIVRGVNPWRRVLGIAGVVWVLARVLG